MKKEEAKLAIESRLRKIVNLNRKVKNAYLLIHSDKKDIHWSMGFGQTGDIKANADQPFHAASLGKSFTATLIAMLAEKGQINFNDPISKFIPEDILKNLHIYKGKDYSKAIKIGHLLGHTSGLADFYEDKPKKGKSFFDMIFEDSSRLWTPRETIQWTRENLKARFPPGAGIHYSDTGYNLLGLIIEQVIGQPYHQVLHDFIFKPLDMHHSYLLQYSVPAVKKIYPVAHLMAKGKEVDVEQYRSFSSIYAGGQTVSTSENLLKFLQALVENKLIRNESLIKMQQWTRLWIGIDYGYGLMRVRMLPFTKKYNAWGHLGSIGSFMLYNPAMDTYLIGNFNSIGYTSKSIRFAYTVFRTLSKIT